jgi:LysM repeat protein
MCYTLSGCFGLFLTAIGAEMSENSDQQSQKPEDTPEYLKFMALLVVFLVVVLAVAALSPRLIGEVTPAVLGIGGAQAVQPEQASEEGPGLGGAPEGSAGPEQASPAESQIEAESLRHVVQAGQTLFQIAELYGVSVEEIAAANNLVSPGQLQAGAMLIIPQ